MSRSRTSPEPASPLLVVMTAASGTGKSTVARRLLAADARLAFSVSHTTRPPRPGEVDGRDYHFVGDATFDAMVARGAFAEWAPVHTRRYGTSHDEIARLGAAGRDILFDVDIQGADKLLAALPGAVSVFMLPPSLAALEQRLRGRATESEAQIAGRLATARAEIPRCLDFDYALVNDEVEAAAQRFAAIVTAERCRRERNMAAIDALLQELGGTP